MATENPDPNKQAEAFRTPQQVINPLTGETVADFQIEPSSLDRKIPSPNLPFPALLYKKSSAGKTLSVKVTNQQEHDRAVSQGWHVGHPVDDKAIVEESAEGLQPLSILDGIDAKPDAPRALTAAEKAIMGAGVAENADLDRARAARDAKNDSIQRMGGEVRPAVFFGDLTESAAKATIAVTTTKNELAALEVAEQSGSARPAVLQAIADHRAALDTMGAGVTTKVGVNPNAPSTKASTPQPLKGEAIASGIADLSVAEAQAAIKAARTAEALDAHETSEYAGKSRASVLAAINARRGELG